MLAGSMKTRNKQLRDGPKKHLKWVQFLPAVAHIRRVQACNPDPAHVVLPGPHRIASLLKRWLLGTHQGSFSYEHLDYYLDEYTFRFNRRSSKARGLLFYRLVEQAVCVNPLTYRGIVGGVLNSGRNAT